MKMSSSGVLRLKDLRTCGRRCGEYKTKDATMLDEGPQYKAKIILRRWSGSPSRRPCMSSRSHSIPSLIHTVYSITIFLSRLILQKEAKTALLILRMVRNGQRYANIAYPMVYLRCSVQALLCLPRSFSAEDWIPWHTFH